MNIGKDLDNVLPTKQPTKIITAKALQNLSIMFFQIKPT